jgi:DNA-binding Xre family transcriptional regulator
VKRDTYRLRSRTLFCDLADKSFSVRALAAEAGCSKSMIQHFRDGTRETCSRDLAKRIEQALRCPVDEMLFAPIASLEKRTVRDMTDKKVAA